MQPTPTELSDILRLHALYLTGDPEGKRADLRGANLRGADLRGAYLQDANLEGAKLQDAIISIGNITRTVA